jgi:hypothetical protein
VLHGLVHFWYVTLSQGWVEFQADMGWTGKSWLFTNILPGGISRNLATLVYGLAAVVFVAAGTGWIADQAWYRPWTIAASLISILGIVMFWDGSFRMPVEKGILGLLISIGLLAAAYLLK